MPISLPAATPSPEVTLRVDDSGTPFGDPPTWSDYSDALATGGDGQPISITRGRGDGHSDPQPSQCTLMLENTSGAYTPGNPAAASGWDVGARINVRLTVAGTTYDRFDGYADSIEPAYPGRDWSLVQVVATDITARLGIGKPMRSLLVEEMLADNPAYLYPLSEAAGSSSAGDITVNGNPAASRVDGKYGAGQLAFGADLELPDPTTGVNFGDWAEYPSPMSVLAIAKNGEDALTLPAAGAHTQECWVVGPESTAGGTGFALHQTAAANNGATVTLLTLNTGVVWYYIADDSGVVVSAESTASIFDGHPHHLVGTLAADRRTLKLYIDGQLVDTGVAASDISLTELRWNEIGGHVTPRGGSSQFPGTVGLVAMYTSALSDARILAHYQAGIGTFVESSDERYARLAGYGGVPTTGLPAGQAEIGHQSTGGKTIIELLQQVARSEGSVSYVTPAGELTFQARDHRYNATTGLTLTSDDIDPGTTTRRDRQGMANEFTVTRVGGASQRYVDEAAQLADGRYDGGSLEVAVSTDADALQIAAWEVNTRKTPRTRLPALNIDLLTLADAGLVEDILAADLSTLLTVTGLPDQAPDTEISVFLEGWTENIGIFEWTLSAFTTPNLPPVWVLEDPVLGEIDADYVIAL